MKNVIVTSDVLAIYDKYDGDFGLLDERWASEQDRKKVTRQQVILFSEYLDQLNRLRTQRMSPEMKASAQARLAELEKVIDGNVVEVVRKRMQRN